MFIHRHRGFSTGLKGSKGVNVFNMVQEGVGLHRRGCDCSKKKKYASKSESSKEGQRMLSCVQQSDLPAVAVAAVVAEDAVAEAAPAGAFGTVE